MFGVVSLLAALGLKTLLRADRSLWSRLRKPFRAATIGSGFQSFQQPLMAAPRFYLFRRLRRNRYTYTNWRGIHIVRSKLQIERAEERTGDVPVEDAGIRIERRAQW
jgi:hypothetical protein